MNDNIPYSFNVEGCFYKYRSLDNLERFLSIIIDRKLYGALYSEMNDPMEGYYQYDRSINQTLLNNLVDGKKRTYICSLSRCGNIGLMWTHYAAENRGCCIEVKVTSKTWRQLNVNYCSSLPTISPATTVSDILMVKAKMWEYEQETRFISPEMLKSAKRPQLSVKITRIFIGCNVDKSRYVHLCKIIKALDKNIEVIKMHKDWLNYGFI